MESLLTLRQQVDPALRCRRVKPDRVPSSVKTACLDRRRRQGCLIQLGMGGICRVGGLCSRPTSKERVSCFYFFSEWLRQARHAHAARTYENCGLCCCEVAWTYPHLTALMLPSSEGSAWPLQIGYCLERFSHKKRFGRQLLS